MREFLRPYTLKEIDLIKQITGVKKVGYEDLIFLKRTVKEVLFANDPQNI